MSPGIKRAETIVYFGIGLVPTGVCLKVEASAKAGCPVGRSTHSPLNLDVFYRGGKVRHVDPKDPMCLCVVEWNAVDGGIDSGLVSAPDADTGIAHPCTCI